MHCSLRIVIIGVSSFDGCRLLCVVCRLVMLAFCWCVVVECCLPLVFLRFVACCLSFVVLLLCLYVVCMLFVWCALLVVRCALSFLFRVVCVFVYVCDRLFGCVGCSALCVVCRVMLVVWCSLCVVC